MAEQPPDPRRECAELSTLRDMLRYAVTLFHSADLHHGHGATTALDEAAFLILETLHLPVDDFNAFAEARLTAREKALLGERLARRVEERIPAAYLTGRTYLKGFSFRSDARAIIPRSFIADLLFSPLFDGSGEPGALVADPEAVTRVLDLCTGGGSLAILAAHAFPNAGIDAVELSPEAAALARENIADYGLADRITLFEGDLFAPVRGRVYDLILSNPPYVDAETMAMLPVEFRHEPAMALGSGVDGLDVTRRILAEGPRHLAPGAGLLCEVGLARPTLEAAFSETAFLWLDTEDSEAEVYWLPREDFPSAAKSGRKA
ncbi:50S ribosomal protein L3 N(5)-glutamine methyltransferase [Rhabdaerophilum sp. SD176]|uniref:50S ribosomal protein L3 N(5)-glutamine methyltransferase n=1 Tax=Rhabdaerophilum sp. SD176 TaxID=2983548 RepID=UPI0024DF4399|nr:50S ribosomal protein L3 N(5)-glutamine methyltransferase [Rhabdaerophilum sp. SD176]